MDMLPGKDIITNEHTEDFKDQAHGLRQMAKEKFDDYSKDKPSTGKIVTDLDQNHSTRVITITSGKGGVGKTSMSVNLALSLVKSGKKVLLFDADLGLANINVMLGVVPKYNLYHVVKGTKSLEDIIISTPEGLDLIAGASGYSMLANLNITEREKIIKEFTKLPPYDIMLIDTGAGVGSNVIGFTMPADEIIVVTTPEPTAITDAYGIIKSIVLQSNDRNIKLLVNRAGSSLEARKVLERVVNISNQFLNVKVESAGYVFEDEHVSKSIRHQKPFVLEFPKSKASACLQLISGRMLNQTVEEFDSQNSGLSNFFRRMFKS